MSQLNNKLSIIEDKKKALEIEKALLIETRKKEVLTLIGKIIEKIPGALSLDNLVLAGIILDGLASVEKDPSRESEFKDIAYKFPSFKKRTRKQKSKTAANDNSGIKQDNISIPNN